MKCILSSGEVYIYLTSRDRGNPYSYCNMNGCSGHTYKWEQSIYVYALYMPIFQPATTSKKKNSSGVTFLISRMYSIYICKAITITRRNPTQPTPGAGRPNAVIYQTCPASGHLAAYDTDTRTRESQAKVNERRNPSPKSTKPSPNPGWQHKISPTPKPCRAKPEP